MTTENKSTNQEVLEEMNRPLNEAGSTNTELDISQIINKSQEKVLQRLKLSGIDGQALTGSSLPPINTIPLPKYDPKNDDIQVLIVKMLNSQSFQDCSNQSFFYVKIVDIRSGRFILLDVRDLQSDYKVLRNKLAGIGSIIQNSYNLQTYILALIKAGHVDLYGFTKYGKILLDNQETIFLVNPETAASYNLEYVGHCSDALKKKGDFPSYIQKLKDIMQNKFFSMGLCVAFSSIICNFLELFDTNFVLCLTGGSHTGKTTLTYFILSLFSNPKELLLNADSTPVGLEEDLDRRPFCPLSFDDSSAKNPTYKQTKERIMKVIFQIGSGTDRVKHSRRSSGTRNVNLIMSSVKDIEETWTGEKDRGQVSRVLQILPDKCGFTYSADYASQVEDFMSQYYGLLFPEFCRRFSEEHFDADALRKKYRKLCQDSKTQAPKIHERIHQRIAAVLLTADVLNTLFEKESMHFDVSSIYQTFLKDPEKKAARHNDSDYYLERIKDEYRNHPEKFTEKRREFNFDAYKGILEKKHDHYLFSVPQADIENLMGADIPLIYEWDSLTISTEKSIYNRLSLKLKGSSSYSKHPFLTFRFEDKEEFFKKSNTGME